LEQKRQFEKIRDDFGLACIILHGSYARGRQRQDSDFDIAFVDAINSKGVIALNKKCLAFFIGVDNFLM
jgi:predicted nucleotidyltransferase